MDKIWPSHWIEVTLEDVVSRMTNGTGVKQLDAPVEGSFPITRIETIAQETIDLKRVKYAIVEGEQLDKFRLNKGDILLSHINSDKHLGKTALFNLDDTVVHGINLLLIRTKDNYDSGFLNYLFRLYRLEGEFTAVAQRAVNQSSINQKKLKSFPVPLPPLAEQKRIVAKLDEAFKHLETLKAKWKKLDALKDKLVERCLVDSKKGLFYRKQPLAMFLEEGTKRIGKDWGAAPKIGVSAKEGIIDLDIGKKSTFENYKIVYPGDFIYNAMRVNIGSIAHYNGKEIAITSPDYIVFRIKHTLSPTLLLSFLKSPAGLLEIGFNTKGSVRSRLYFKSLGCINYPVSPIELQEKAEKLLSSFSRILGYWKGSLEPRLRLVEAGLLDKAFRGELVPQDENYEPASELF